MGPRQLARIRYSDGSKYLGQTKDGEPDGVGTLKFADGTRVSGEFKGTLVGFGYVLWPDGFRYQGETQGGQPHGLGFRVLPGKEFYEGEFENGQPHGRGQVAWTGDGHYEGEFKDGYMDGYGTRQ